MTSVPEVWKPVVGFEGQYEVSNAGRVRSLARVVSHPHSGSISVRERVLRNISDRHGYHQVSVGRKGRKVHALVLEAFVGPRPDGYEACHGNGNPSDNSLSNLRWGTPKENGGDRTRHGRVPSGERHFSAKLTAGKVSEIIQSNDKSKRLARKYKVSDSVVRDIRNGKTWKEVRSQVVSAMTRPVRFLNYGVGVISRPLIPLFLAAILVGQAFADCPNCDDGLVRMGQVLYPCPLCCGKNESDFPHGLKEKGTKNPDKNPSTSEDVQGLRTVGQSAQVPTDPHKSVVRITSENKDSTSLGSGVVVEHGGKVLILTAKHVVFDDDKEGLAHTIRYQDGTETKAKLVASNDPFDIAALAPDKCDTPAVRVCHTRPDLLDRITIVGFGGSKDKLRAAGGAVDGRWKPVGRYPMDRFSSSVGARQGDSGGPVFNEAGEVVGILSSSDGKQTWATHCERVRAMLDGEKESSCPDGKCRKR